MPKVLVFGDVILDRYLIGASGGISPEGAFPLIKMGRDHEDYRLGGAANCANCIKKLVPDSQVDLIGMIGTDFASVKVRQILEKADVGFEDMNYTDKHPTILKTRVCIGNKQVVRYDIEDDSNLDPKQLPKVIDKLTKIAKNYDVLVVSDYNKGIVNALTFACVSINSDGFVIVDPKKRDFSIYAKCDMITPNLKEFALALDEPTKTRKDKIKGARSLMLTHGIKSVLITMSEDGMLFVEKNKVTHYPTKVKTVIDVTGAGDTVVATIAAMKADKKSMNRSIEIANIAAGLVVEKFGTETITRKEIDNV